MTLERRNDRWRVIVDVGQDPITGRRQRVTKTLPHGATQKDARDEQARLRLKGKPRARTKTVGVLLEEWFAGLSTDDYSPRTLQGYRQHIDEYLTPALGNVPVRKLDVHRIETLYRALRARGLSATTIKRIHATLSGACKAAVRWGWIPTSPCPNVDTGRSVRHDIEPPTIGQIAAVLEYADEDLRNAVGLALATGARAGELCGLQWADIRFDNASVIFRRSVANVGAELEVIEDRRKSRIRTVAIDAVTLAMLEARAQRAGGGDDLRPDDRPRPLEPLRPGPETLHHFVLSQTPHGDPLSPRLLGQRWAKAAKTAGLAIRFHDLRHAHATALLAGGLPVPNTVLRMGWSSPAMIRVYGHAVAQLDEEASRIAASRLTLPPQSLTSG